MKVSRHAKIIELISQYDIETQEELAEYLNNAGFKVTQATVSRDIRDLKLTKLSVNGGRQKYIVHRQEDDGMNEKYIRVLRSVCYSYSVPFSFSVQEGGYIYESGDYARETSLVLTLIDAEKTVVDEIARDLCAFFHQESVLVTESQIQAHFIRET